ncbi:MAG: ATP-binding cassette domain-containing protein [Clostridiales bacterium]|nr:ATP-binding cassette domain-containing protein [Clostridiales bacterium]
MGNTIIKLDNITKKYGKATVVDNFSVEIEQGSICGLIGPNGAGKTTIMKMMAGLTSISSGKITYFGNKGINNSLGRLSFMIENPMLDINMTAQQNMEYIRCLKGISRKERIDELLDFVGLSDVGSKKTKKFSLGMRQRLGIAMSLLSEPDILVLDEPVNGLDPEGMVDVRKMLSRLSNERNVTILISSHLLSELSELCTDYAIINRGCLVEHISAEELAIKCENHLTVKTDDVNRTATVLEQQLGIKNYKVFHGEEIHVFEKFDDLSKISKTITNADLTILKFICEGANLEEYYLSKVGGNHA